MIHIYPIYLFCLVFLTLALIEDNELIKDNEMQTEKLSFKINK